MLTWESFHCDARISVMLVVSSGLSILRDHFLRQGLEHQTLTVVMLMLSAPLGSSRTFLLGILLVASLGTAACSGLLGSTDSEEQDPSAADSLLQDSGTKGIHRLNSAEYNATVADVLGTSLQPATANWRGGELEGFDNMASVLGVDGTQYERYLNAAEELVGDVLASPELRDQLIPCTETDDDTCVRAILDTSGLKIFRRPLSEDEVQTYSKVYQDARALEDDHYASAGLMIQALLSSAEFLYRIELDPDPSTTEKHPLSAYELASRLSYFLWSSAPDDKLLSLAGDGSLLEEEVLRKSVEEMLDDEKSERFIANFAGQWLGARRVADHPTSPDVYPSWNPDVAAAAAEEMYLYFGEFLHSDRSWLEFLRADVNFVDASLAEHYGMPAPASGRERRENVADERHGFLGLAGFLAISSFDRRTSPTLRGKWVLLNLMCTEPPPPPPGADIAELDEPGSGETQNIRDKLEQHRGDPSCAACHSMFDPFGLALEHFDGIGKFRTAYADNEPIDASTDLFGEPFSGLEGTAEIVSSHPDFGPCVAEKMLTYALGRHLNDADMAHLEKVSQQWLGADQTPTLARAIEGLVLTETFRYRRGEGEGGSL